MSRKKQKVLQECFQFADFCYRSSSDKVLSDLPDEILSKIFGYLAPPTLAQISNLRIRRLTVAASFMSVDFSTCNTISLEDLQSFFVEERLNLLQEINFNNVFFALPFTLKSFTVMCKNITVLYVFNCGLNYSHIGSIFNSCKCLRECYWSLPEDDDRGMSKVISSSLKKLYLHVQLEARNTKPNLLSFLKVCPNLEEICVNFTPCYITSVPTNVSTKYISFKHILKSRNLAINLVVLSSTNRSSQERRLFIESVNMLEKLKKELIAAGEDTVKSDVTHDSALLQLFAHEKILDELPQLKNESVKSLVIIMDDIFYNMVPHLERINKMTGKELKHLSLSTDNISIPHVDHPTEYNNISTLLRGIIVHSVNITVLSLAELHMPYIFPLPTNCPMKHLKAFNICACCLASPQTERACFETHEKTGTKLLEEFVLNCKKVEEFGLYGCKECVVGPTDEKLVPLSLWNKLKRLTLEGVRSVRTCQFLVLIANLCPNLKMVELVQLSLPNLCHFIPSVVHILKNSEELVFLRINQPGFYPMEPLFWKSVESAQNLEGLCLGTALPTYIENKPILEALNELPYLHIFHFMARRTCDNLKVLVRRIMNNNGVKTPNIMAPEDVGETFEPCFRRHYAMI